MLTTTTAPANLALDLSHLRFTHEQSPTQLSGEDVLTGFILDLTTVW